MLIFNLEKAKGKLMISCRPSNTGHTLAILSTRYLIGKMNRLRTVVT